MTMQSIIGSFCANAARFRTASGANVTTLFALSLLPIVGAVGAAVDYSQAASIKSAMQAAADAASLGTVKSASTLTNAQLQSAAVGMFNSSFNRPQVSPSVSATYDAATSTVTLLATASSRL